MIRYNEQCEIISLSSSELPAEDQDLKLVVEGEHTGTRNTSEDVGSGSLEEAPNALGGEDLPGAVDGSAVLFTFTGGHHHSSSDGVDGVRGKASTDGDTPAEKEVSNHAILGQVGLEGVEDTEVKTSVDDDTDAGDHEASVETSNTVRGKGLLVDVDETVELFFTTLLGVLEIVRQPSSSVVEGVDEEEGDGASSTSGSEVTSEPDPVSIPFLIFSEKSFEIIFKGEVEGLSGEVSQHVGAVALPESLHTFFGDDPGGAVANALVGDGQGAVLEHGIHVLESELDELDGGGEGLGDGSRDTTHQELDGGGLGVVLLLSHS